MKVLMKVTNKNGQYMGREVSEGDAPRKRKAGAGERSEENRIFEEAYQETRLLELGRDDALRHIQMLLLSDERFERLSSFASDALWITDQYDRCSNNYFAKKKRMMKKAYMGDFNYFVTFTYDDKKISEAAFSRKLRKTLQNMTYFYHWTYMGVMEKGSEGGRTHYHFLINVPEGRHSMPGYLHLKSHWSEKKHTRVAYTSNSHFEKFGKNEWEAIDRDRPDYIDAVKYLAKYLGKQDSRVIYSRNVPEDVTMMVDTKRDVMFARYIWGRVYVLFKSLFEKEKDNEENIFCPQEVEPLELVDWRFVSRIPIGNKFDLVGLLEEARAV